jgi:phage tail sheath protein FI
MQTSVRRTPGVYITELDAFPPSAVGVQTAVPAFIGYTEKAIKNGQPLLNKPTKINSVDDFELYFGGAPAAQFSILDANADPQTADFHVGAEYYKLDWTAKKYYLYNCVRLFYENGGGPCYIVSVGNYAKAVALADFSAGLTALSYEVGPTMLLAPDALLFLEVDKANYGTLAKAMLAQANDKQDRIAVLDVYNGFEREYVSGGATLNTIDQFRTDVGSLYLNYGVAYYPWLHTSIVQNNEIDFTNIADGTAGIDELKTILDDEASLLYANDVNKLAQVQALIALLSKSPAAPNTVLSLSQDIGAAVPLLFDIYRDMQRKINVLPPASAMAGVYNAVDSSRGVWKAPANIALNSVIAPTVYIDDDAQADLNVPLNGKAVNALRSFPGQGIMVWGGRTLDGNSKDYRYVNVRRTLIYIEQSLKIAASVYLFEPNDANTWVSVKGMIENFLMGVWQGGGLMGDKASDAYVVNVGLGATMTGNDILDGYMRIQVLLQMLRPTEFIELTFQQKMQGL